MFVQVHPQKKRILFQYLKPILLRDSFKQVGIYTITGSLAKVISFAALPFFVNTLSAGDIGILTIFSSCIVFLSPIVSLGVLYTISVDYFTLSKQQYAVVFSSSLLIPLSLCFLLVPLLYIFSEPLAILFNFPQQFFWLIPLCLFFNFCFEAFVIVLRNKNNVNLFAGISLLKIVLEITVAILLIIFIYRNWYGRALGFLFAGAVVVALFFIYMRKNRFLVKRFSFAALKSELSFGLSGLVLQTAIFFVTGSDKFFVMAFFGKEQAGYYSVASTFAAIQFIICTSLSLYLSPVLFKGFAENKKWKDLRPVHLKYTAAMSVTFLATIIFTYLVYSFILKASYKQYINYAFLLSISSFIWTICNLFLQYLIFTKSKKLILVLSVTIITISITLNYFAAKYFPIEWLCVVQTLTVTILLFIILLFNNKLNYFR
jgi:O-antigen/teichoic acid export membrane protein